MQLFPPRFDLSLEEHASSYSGPAVAANKIFSKPIDGGFRISFCEQHEPIPTIYFRAAVVLSVSDTIALRDLLDAQLRARGVEAENGANTQ